MSLPLIKMSKPLIVEWFSSPRPNPGASLRLFCFPYAGGNAAIYRGWPRLLPAEIEVYTAQLPGRGKRIKETPYTDPMTLVGAMAESILPYLDKPFAFFGHSMGAMLSFELARRLRNARAPRPLHLFVSGCRALQLPPTRGSRYDLPAQEFIEELRHLKGTPPEVLAHPELMELMLPLLRADFSIVETYRYSPGPPLDCSLTVVGGLEDADVSRSDLEAWRELSAFSCNVLTIPGDHFFINTMSSLLLEIIARELQKYIYVNQKLKQGLKNQSPEGIKDELSSKLIP